MSIFFIFLLLILFFPLFGVGTDDCVPDRCRKHGPKIQFPFRLKNRQPEYCGYPGFDVDCDDKHQTVLVLPASVTVVVKKIDYVSQHVQIYDPEKCFSRNLPHLNLSASPFNFLNYYLSDYILFNCSTSETYSRYFLSCPSDSRSNIYAMEYGSYMDSYPLTSCTTFQNVSSVPSAVFYENDLDLNWSEPACGNCEAQGRRCTLNNFTGGHQIRCIDKTKVKKGTSKKSLIEGATLGSFFVVMILAALVILYNLIMTSKENHKKIEKFLEDYRALKPTRFCYSDIRRITNNFSEKLGEGGYGIVYKGKLSNEINVAVKVLNNPKENGEEFVNEVSTIGRIHHVNVVRLIGFCAEGFRRASQVYFPQWIYNHLNLGDDLWAHIEEGDHGNIIARKLTIIGLQCIQWYPSDRPSMKVVVQMLEGDGDLTMPPNPFPAANATDFVTGIIERHYQAELPLILEVE